MTLFDKNYNPAIGSANGKYDITDLGADPTPSNGDVIAYSTSAGTFVTAASAPSSLTDSHIFVGDVSNVPQDVAMSGDVTIDNTGATTISNGAVMFAMLDAGIAPASISIVDETYTTAGGSATEVISPLVGVTTADRVYVQLVDDGTNNVSVKSAITMNGAVSVTFSGDPGNDAVINLLVTKDAS